MLNYSDVLPPSSPALKCIPQGMTCPFTVSVKSSAVPEGQLWLREGEGGKSCHLEESYELKDF